MFRQKSDNRGVLRFDLLYIIYTKSKKMAYIKEKRNRQHCINGCVFIGALGRGNKPPVQPGEDKKAVQKKNLQV